MLDAFFEFLRTSAFAIFIAVVCFFILSLWLRSFIKMGVDALLAPRFYSRISKLNLFGFTYEIKDGKLSYITRSEIPLVSDQVAYDFQKYQNIESDKMDKAEDTMLFLSAILTFVISLILAVLIMFLGRNLTGILLVLVVSFGLGLLFHGASSVVFAIISYHKIKTSLAGYMRKAINKIRASVPFENLNLKAVEELPYTNVANYEYVLYGMFYFAYLDASNQYSKMEPLIATLRDKLNSVQFNIQYLGTYYAVIYYYCYHCPDKLLAEFYYNSVKEYVEKDTDANGLRIRAFYEFIVNDNKEKALEFADKANAALPHFSGGSEREYESKCIDKLFERLTA